MSIKNPLSKKGNQVVMHTCIEAKNPNNYKKSGLVKRIDLQRKVEHKWCF
ncbi:hypothetical protein [Brevibacillus laterosporus]|nr:hypothetical protein [Brevibacillus laterosporus]WNX33243.1 hypothetical protein RWW94_10790 [Brevibacillus laterosporus]